MNKDSLRISALGLVLLIAGFVVAFQFVEPSPPSTITIASGSKTGAYYQFAQRYSKILARQGIRLEILETQGSVENIQLLSSGKADVAFVQGGVGDAAKTPDLRSLGSLYFEPLWVFVQKSSSARHLSDLAGRTLAVGAEGSGTWAVTRQLLAQNDVETEGKNIRHLSSQVAARDLLAGKVDAAFFVTSPQSALVSVLLAAKELRLLSFDRAPAYTRQMHSLSAVTLHRGVVSLSGDIPPANVQLLAPAATLATHQDLHPALQNLLIQATLDVHGGGGVFEDPGQFPSALYGDYPLSADAERYLKNGPPLLQRYLPFWAAVMFDRLKILLVPLITLLFPLFKILPPAYRWRVRSRIYRWYDTLGKIERRAAQGESPLTLHKELAEMADEVRSLKVPLSYADQVYSLRLHIDLVQRSLP